MTPESVVDIFQDTLELLTLLVSICLLPALAIGLVVAMFQAATSINEMTLSFIPKLLITFATLMVAGPYMLNLLLSYMHRMIVDIPMMIG
ncbi:MAG: flagellar biosynthetic protein FliQ [Gammaproteobacteria bacterium]|nr:flagellar biosynthetic protein FliQ [Gammaproteobacteria bacterium]